MSATCRVIGRFAVPLAVILCARLADAAAPCDGTESCLRALETAQRGTRVLSARFEQTKHLSLLAEPLVSRGRFGYRAPDEVLWEVEAPPLTVRIDRQGVHLPDRPDVEAEMATLAPFSKMLRELSEMFTGSFTTIQHSFAIEAKGDASGIAVYLVPQEAQWRATFRAIDLRFAVPALLIQTIRIQEALGDSLEIVFSDVHRNDVIAETLFHSNERKRP